MANDPCPKCPYYQYAFHAKDYISREAFPIEVCEQCGNGRTDTCDIKETPNFYYSKYYYGEEHKKFHPWLETIILGFRAFRANKIRRLVKGKGSILDIGSARGYFLSIMKKNGWYCVGTEISPQAAVYAKEKFDLTVHVEKDIGELKFAENTFDVVTLFHVFEHIDEPGECLTEINRILKPGGFMVFEVPNFGSFQSRLIKRNWHHLDTPRHLYHYTIPGVKRMLANSGFKVVKVSTLSLEFGPFGMIQSILNAITFDNDLLFKFLKGKITLSPDNTFFQKAYDIFVNIILFLPLLILSTIMETVAVIFGKGSVIYIMAQRERQS